jgi:hypothetical protein
MGKYGRTAEIAVQLVAKNGSVTPREALDSAALTMFPNSSSSRTKGCPRGSFLGLCEMGVVQNVAAGSYTGSVENKDYAVRALQILRSNPALSSDKRTLWQTVTDGAGKAPNGQMDVVTTLFRSGLVR